MNTRETKETRKEFKVDELSKRYLQSVTRRFNHKAEIKPKSQADWKLKFIRFWMVTVLRHKTFDSMIQNIGPTIWVPDDFFYARNKWNALTTIAHETVHIADQKKLNPVFFAFLYLMPQSLVVVPLLLALFCSPWWLIGLGLLAPIPLAFGRIWLELRAYKMNVIFDEMVWVVDPRTRQNYHRHRFAEMMTDGTYYWAFFSKSKLMGLYSKAMRLFSINENTWAGEAVYWQTIQFIMDELKYER